LPVSWPVARLPVIEQAIRMLLDGSIIRRHYDARAGEIVAKD